MGEVRTKKGWVERYEDVSHPCAFCRGSFGPGSAVEVLAEGQEEGDGFIFHSDCYELASVVAMAAGLFITEVKKFYEIYDDKRGAVWAIVRLADGRWAVADDEEVDPGEVHIFASKEEAFRYSHLKVAASSEPEMGNERRN